MHCAFSLLGLSCRDQSSLLVFSVVEHPGASTPHDERHADTQGDAIDEADSVCVSRCEHDRRTWRVLLFGATWWGRDGVHGEVFLTAGWP